MHLPASIYEEKKIMYKKECDEVNTNYWEGDVLTYIVYISKLYQFIEEHDVSLSSSQKKQS